MRDLIDRQAAIDAILHNQEVYANNFGDDPIDKYTIAIIDNDARTIAQLPTAERKGHWENYLKNGLRYKCSVCGSRYNLAWNYCPNCGARMEAET